MKKLQGNLPYEREGLIFFLVKFVWEEKRGAENFRQFEKFSEVSGGGQLEAGGGQLGAHSREIILKSKRN